ncbi:hypothetical protein J6590_007095 [Homalodisca vitripennis]|nr:hypothetical protein J6590_007095 [Homalodisca vitripennis]
MKQSARTILDENSLDCAFELITWRSGCSYDIARLWVSFGGAGPCLSHTLVVSCACRTWPVNKSVPEPDSPGGPHYSPTAHGSAWPRPRPRSYNARYNTRPPATIGTSVESSHESECRPSSQNINQLSSPTFTTKAD